MHDVVSYTNLVIYQEDGNFAAIWHATRKTLYIYQDDTSDTYLSYFDYVYHAMGGYLANFYVHEELYKGKKKKNPG